LRRSLRDDPSPEDSASQAGSSNRAPQVLFADSDGTRTAPGQVGIIVNPATHTMINAYANGYGVQYDTYGLPASKAGLSPVVDFIGSL
jgi:hypothetical protein